MPGLLEDPYGNLTYSDVGKGLLGNYGVLQRAMKQYPRVAGQVNNFTYGPGPGMLEYWPASEQGTTEQPRPAGLPVGQPGIQINKPNVRPTDIAGDIASHQMIHSDPVVGSAYQQFVSSLTEEQRAKLRRDYEWAQKNEGENRPFTQWAETTRLPAYFRGYTFQQWPKSFNDQFYTTEQKRMLDSVASYLRGQ